MIARRACTALLCASLAAGPAAANCARDAMVVFDGSASMGEIGFDTGETNRITDARAAMERIMPQVEGFRRIGLVTYGRGLTGPCAGTTLHFTPRADAAGSMRTALDALSPDGLTPLAAAVEHAAEVLDYRLQPAIVVLVTDGNETCGGQPCALGRTLSATAANLTIHVIGYKAEGDFFSWDNPEATEVPRGDIVAKCLADTTGGTFAATDTVEELVEALWETLGCPLVGRAS
ncbi:vWA domain-containing protein [Jannaschia marina]|uniref:vWA domain-containing protein n=1 Tax=Jannaschia marina TaxID=2741674 RepID=UPI001F3F59EB|nr:VWA domain-containing protein [Jannaschia marina]